MNNKQLPWTDWFERAKAVKTTEDFADLVKFLFNGDIMHTYDSSVHAVSALALAGASLGAYIEGITGFQSGFVKFDFMREWDGIGKKIGVKVVDFDHYLIYPQYVEKCPVKAISLSVWKAAQKACAEKLNALDTTTFHKGNGYVTENTACYAVRQYWADVCNGIIPDCLHVVEDTDALHGIGFSRIDPIVVSRPAHTIADKERDYNDESSPWYDEERTMREREEWRKKYESEMISCVG